MSIHSKVSEFCSLYGYEYDIRTVKIRGRNLISHYEISIRLGNLAIEKHITQELIDYCHIDHLVDIALRNMHRAIQESVKASRQQKR